MDVTSQLLAELNSRQRWQRVLKLYTSRMSLGNSSPDESSAYFHLQAATAAASLQIDTSSYETTMFACDDCDDDTLGDLYREKAAASIATDVQLANDLLRQAFALHQEFSAKYYIDLSTLGCINENIGLLSRAFDQQRNALTELTKLLETNDPLVSLYRRRVAVCLLRVTVKISTHTRSGVSFYRNLCYKIVLSEDQSWQNRTTAFGMRWLGRPSYCMYRQFIR